MTETTITNVTSGGRSGYGAVPLTVSVLNFDPTLGCDSATFQPCSDRALSSLKVVGDAFREIYPINKKLSPNQSPFFGFFLEDKLYGGQVKRQLAFSLLSWLTTTFSPTPGAILCVVQRRRTDI
jgi:glucoamylase